MKRGHSTLWKSFCLVGLLAIGTMSAARGQGFTTDDPVIRSMWEEGMENSHTEQLAHTLIDYYGPRLAGSPNLAAAQDWLVDLYTSWGVPVRKEQYGTWDGWDQGILHVDMLEPRVRTLEAHMLAWSPPTNGPVEGEVVMPPEGLDEAAARNWLSTVRGKYVLASPPEQMCRAPQEVEANARPETIESLDSARTALSQAFLARQRPIVMATRKSLQAAVDSAGAAGVLTSRWSNGWGVNKVFSAGTERAVAVDVSCEDYGLLYRLIEGGSTPVLRVEATSRDLGTVPQFNVIAEFRGTELPDEYVLLGAHLDSWGSASGATDNGTGSITMLEAARILKETYPNPRRTIIIGHWANEEMGLLGSSAFREDHPEVIEGLQAAFNQDNGTWAFERIEGQGYLHSGEHLARWMAPVPSYISDHILLETPGPQAHSGSDHSSFVCAGAPSFRLQSPYPEYQQYTWHTNRDTYDKIAFNELKENATLAAMMAYGASEDPVRFDREKAILPGRGRGGQARTWPTCRPPRREAR
jgi:hypothetical protein